MSSPLLEPFREAYRNLELLPLLTDRALERFGVEYGTEVIEELEQLVEDSPSGDGKILLAGHRGCGKSTLLYEFKRKLDDRYFVVFFSISDTIEMSDVNHVNILFSIAVQMMNEAEAQRLVIKESQKQSFYRWFAEQTRTEIDQFEASVEGGFNFTALLTYFKGILKANSIIRDEIKQKYERRISDLVAQINIIASAIQSQSDKEILVIVDDLDKIDLAQVRDIFQSHIKAIMLPGFRIIMTIPIAALREVALKATLQTETNGQIVQMPVYKLFKQVEIRLDNRHPDPEALARLKETITKRVDPRLIEPDTLEKICIYSGGVLRELIRITNACCRICLRSIRRTPENSAIKINNAILEESITQLSIDFDTSIGAADYEIIKMVYEQFKPTDPKDQKFLDLLHGLYILEYRNGDLWYYVHPIVIELMRKKGLI
ncbi:ATP-binding protein [Pannus brasiliensis CCIBt3594]|uniref:ATP-binding protein n=1 Tax=Pannus brasiliensis CCIBt3594 TaxID=1427578 RepID=A0AAW9QZE9_9CHRO